ncbi:EVE domain-containing protein, partial [bacterium]|nr:EVE domain-containing protein [bacterium]
NNFFYVTNKTDKEIVGTARIVGTPMPDPKDEAWTTVEIAALDDFPHAVSLEQIKRDEVLKEMLLVKQSRLSVMPVTAPQAKKIEKMARV